jgi:hypothetical protein
MMCKFQFTVISTIWRTVHTGCAHLFPCLCVSSEQCSVWTLEVLSVTPVQHVCQYVNELALDYAIAEAVRFQLPTRVAQVR